jgi:vacuolar iron transporter family protein
MSNDLRQGFIFGLNSGIITTAGLIAGLVQANVSKIIIIISVISLAISDSVSEGYGMFLSKKAEDIKDFSNGPYYALISLLLTKFFVVMSFLIPMLFTNNIKIYKNLSWIICWSIFLIVILDINLSILRKESFMYFFIPHIVILLFVIFVSKNIGKYVEYYTK